MARAVLSVPCLDRTVQAATAWHGQSCPCYCRRGRRHNACLDRTVQATFGLGETPTLHGKTSQMVS
ncbi:MAG: hypothetical protein NZ874_09050 [Fimbriimonadales bacterium]|nr:hypothetical protein [Fimbriimonadales bacterium]